MRYRYNCHCSCGRCRVHGFMGPVFLITIGVLFLLSQMPTSEWLTFHRTWPALLIVMGLVLFLEHNASAAGHVPREYGAGPPAWTSQDQRYGTPPYPPQPPAPPSQAVPDVTWKKPDDPEVHNG
jgi:LiaF transmembrane domain